MSVQSPRQYNWRSSRYAYYKVGRYMCSQERGISGALTYRGSAHPRATTPRALRFVLVYFNPPSILHPSIFLFLVLFNSTLLTLPTHAACSPHSSSPPSWPAHRTPSSTAIRARPSCESRPKVAVSARDTVASDRWRRRAEFVGAWARAGHPHSAVSVQHYARTASLPHRRCAFMHTSNAAERQERRSWHPCPLVGGTMHHSWPVCPALRAEPRGVLRIARRACTDTVALTCVDLRCTG